MSHHALVSLTLQENETKCLEHIFCTAFLYSLSPHFFFLIEGGLLSNIGLISAIYQYELANRCTYVPSLLNLPSTSHPFPPPTLLEPQSEFPESCSKFPWAVYFTCGSEYASMLLSLEMVEEPSYFPVTVGQTLYHCEPQFPTCEMRMKSGQYTMSPSRLVCHPLVVPTRSWKQTHSEEQCR